MIDGCIGWDEPAEPEVKVRYNGQNISQFNNLSGNTLNSCTIRDSNGAIPSVGRTFDLLEDQIVRVQTSLLECTQDLARRRTKHRDLNCQCPADSGGIFADLATDTATIECQEPALVVTKECAGQQDSNGDFPYSVTVTNTGTATLENCVISDPGATCSPTSLAGPLTPGQDGVFSCTSPDISNTATVTCNIQGAFDSSGQPKTISGEDSASCNLVKFDKQVSCDAGQTWNDVGFFSTSIEGCTGWTGDGVADEVRFRYRARNFGSDTLTNCVITETNGNVIPGGSLAVADIAPDSNTTVETTGDLACGTVLQGGEPNTATLTCDSPTGQVSDSDTATLDCEEAKVEVVKECSGAQDPNGDFPYAVTVTNTGTATLENCVISDPGATCSPTSIAGPLGPGQAGVFSCTSPNITNTAAVTCDVAGTLDPSTGQPKKVSDEDSASCNFVKFDKQVSCDAGQTWNDIGFFSVSVQGCTGWTGAGVADEVRFRYRARNFGSDTLTNCVITETNGNVIPGGSVAVADIAPDSISTVKTTGDLACDAVLQGGEPNTATLTCDSPTGPVSDSDTATLDCEEAKVEVMKECQLDPSLSFGPNVGVADDFTYAVTVTNPGTAALANCFLDDPGAVCGPLSQTSLPSGGMATASCDSPNATNTVTVTCDVVGAFFPDGTPKTVTDEFFAKCFLPEVDVVKECTASADAQGNFEYSVTVTNTGTENLLGCFLTDPGAQCDPLSAANLLPGETATATCLSPSDMNMVTVTCDVEGGEDPVTDEAMAGCISVIKEVSCDGGQTFDDNTCTGWNTTDPNDPNDPGREIVFRFSAKTGAAMTQCVLTDSSPAIPPAPPIGSLPSKFDGVIYETQLLYCDELEPFEPDTATLTCVPVPDDPNDPPRPPVSDSDMADLTCEPPPTVDVVKECSENNNDGTYTYTVKVTNSSSIPIDSCVLTDTNPVPANCTALSPGGPLPPGAMATATCTSDSNMNMVRVDCLGAGKPISDEAMAGCVDVIKEVSCDAGQTWNDDTCTGWNTTDPNDPNDPGREIVFRFSAKTGAAMTQCVLTDSSPAIPPAPPIGSLPSKFDGVIYETQLLYCDELEPFEPDTATLTCVPVPDDPNDPPRPPVSDSDMANLTCEPPPTVDVVKECSENNNDGTYTYTVKVTNSSSIPIDSCVLTDTNPVPANCTALSPGGPLPPGAMATATCTSDSNMNMVRVDCLGAGKPISDEAMAGCVDVIKEVSCDAGQTWNDDTCTGWNTTDPNDPNDPGREIVFRFSAKTGAAMTQCVLTDSSPAIPPAPPIGSLPSKFDGVIYETQLLYCDELEPFEPDTATLTCVPVPDDPNDPPRPPVSDSDMADLTCEPPPTVDVVKECSENNNDGTYTYTVKVTNSSSIPIDSCVLTDTNPVPANCTALSPGGPLPPGAMATATCTSDSNMNMVRVDCLGAGKPISDEAMAGCVDVIKEVSCDAGQTWNDDTCTGWNTTDPNDPNDPGREIVFRFSAKTGAAMTQCVLTDSSPAIPPAPPIGSLPSKFDGVIYETQLLYCDELEPFEPDTATLTCVPVPDDPNDPPRPPVSDSDMADLTCEPPPTVDVVKECSENNNDGTYTYTVKVTNSSSIPIDSCVLTDTNPVPANCTALSPGGPLPPGAMATATCTSDSNMNMVRVDCLGAGKPISDEAMAGCVDVIKEVSCDAGQTWNDDTCTGWNTTDPNDPNDPGREIVFRFSAKTGAAMTQCVLTDSSPAIPPAPPIGSLPSKFDGVIYETQLLYCDELEPFEPDTATLTCVPVDEETGQPTGHQVSDRDDADLECQEPSLRVEKECAADVDPATGLWSYTVTVTNDGEAPLDNCALTDSSATDCDKAIGTLEPGQTDTATCTSEFYRNEATVTCDIRGADKPITSSDEAECTQPEVWLDKQVSCDSGATWHDVGFHDDVTLGCVGWEGTSDPNEQVLVRYMAQTTGYVVDCTLSDTNTVFLPQPLDVGSSPQGEIHRTALTECSEDQVGWSEPNTATLDCSCLEGPNVPPTPVSDSDTANIECQEPSLRVVKECAADVDPATGLWSYTVTVTNDGEAPLDNCALTDSSATDCDKAIGTLEPGQTDTAICTSEFYRNEATVTCDIRGADKPITSSDEAECTQPEVWLDKQVSCDSGATWHDVGYHDDVTLGCVGWEGTSDPNEQVLVRYMAQTTGYVVDCQLSDTNTVFLPVPLDVGSSPQGEIHRTALTECSEDQVGWSEPNTATLDCSCLEGPNVPPTPVSDSDTANIECQEPSLRVEKECAADVDPATGLWSYTVTVTNDGEAPLDNCALTDSSATDCDKAIGTLEPGQTDTATCTSEFYRNEATVTCDIRGADKPITSSDEAECTQPEVWLDKQVSCDSGATWHDVGFHDDVTLGCVGWEGTSDPNEQVLVRYMAQTTGYVVDCTLSDTNTVFLPQPLDVGSSPQGEIHRTSLVECSEDQLGWSEPNTATLDCACLEGPNLPPTPVTDSDTANIECQEPSLRVEKECAADVDPATGLWSYTVTVTNDGEAPLDNCALTDSSATDCDKAIGTLEPGQTDTATCTSEFYRNEATVTCDIRGADKPITSSDEAECTQPEVWLDKQVSCDSGATWHDVGFHDDVTLGCVGWEGTSDPNEQVLVRYIAQTTGYVVDCTLSDTNTVFLPQPLDVGSSPQGEIHRTALTECSEDQVGWSEPNTATLDCACLEGPNVPPTPVSDSDTANIECQEPSLGWSRSARRTSIRRPVCAIYTVTVTNDG